ncbi:pyridoxamine 5'-phosphate oxidase [Brachybacterium sp. UMB0905]|uniref:pyridoxamine 5'-phosphate oxidase n=1 Tax=Brachybacterium sp. UMB0905 TaxID=2069310 RepID=UPI000C7FA3B8|nr:pyridoxamine 5'-phosphate oxidase [Brachybacterium sp. UMB0905]PMC76103.1 pyridoxamine 5'-phosphate oxidase [Brachybacterium sp. UMB0905]
MTTPPPVDPRDRLASERLDYTAGMLGDDAPTDPLALFDTWLEDALARRETHGDLPEPSAVVLSTVDLNGPVPQPRSRTVLLKGREEDSFVLFTNYHSAKGRELAATPQAALLLPWYPLQRQVRIEGPIEQLPATESDAYWASRPRGSQLGSCASQQSAPIASRAALEQQQAQVAERYEGQDVPRPPHWGGLRVVAQRIEFWQGRSDRLHDRLVYERADDGAWQRQRLQP